jgi:hypothetical protein
MLRVQLESSTLRLLKLQSAKGLNQLHYAERRGTNCAALSLIRLTVLAAFVR